MQVVAAPESGFVNDTLIVSNVGYETYRIAQNMVPDTVFMTSIELNEVVIMPDSSIKNVLSVAYESIHENYPQVPTSLMGFYKEVSKRTKDADFDYFSESIFQYEIPAYTKAGQNFDGLAKLIKTRNYKNPKYEKEPYSMIGGPFLPITFNSVLKRRDFLKPNNFKEYDYSLLKKIISKTDIIYIIGFKAKKNKIEGEIYIRKSDFAYLKIIINNFDKQKSNPSFTVQLKNENVKTVTVAATDIYGNTSILNLKVVLTETDKPVKRCPLLQRDIADLIGNTRKSMITLDHVRMKFLLKFFIVLLLHR